MPCLGRAEHAIGGLEKARHDRAVVRLGSMRCSASSDDVLATVPAEHVNVNIDFLSGYLQAPRLSSHMPEPKPSTRRAALIQYERSQRIIIRHKRGVTFCKCSANRCLHRQRLRLD